MKSYRLRLALSAAVSAALAALATGWTLSAVQHDAAATGLFDFVLLALGGFAYFLWQDQQGWWRRVGLIVADALAGALTSAAVVKWWTGP